MCITFALLLWLHNIKPPYSPYRSCPHSVLMASRSRGLGPLQCRMSLVDGQHSQFLWDGSSIGPGNTDHKPPTSFTSPNGLSNGDISCGNFRTDLHGRLNLERHTLNVKRLRPMREGEPWPQSSKSRISGRLQTTWARSESASIDTFSMIFNCPSARKPDQKRCGHPNELPQHIDEGPATLKTRSKLSQIQIC